MKIKFAAWFLIFFVLTACSQSGDQPTVTPEPQQNSPTLTPTPEILSTVTPVCISPEPSQDDIDRALSFTGQVFQQEDWEQSHTVSEDRVSVSWLSNSQGAVAFLEALIFPCGYEEPDLNAYFADENWTNVFANYQSYELQIECRSDVGLRLYKFSAVSEDVPYIARYWVMNDTNNRVITFMILMAGESFAGIDPIGYSLFPQLSNCS
ncbi:MAG: hypothetical protein HYU84_01905 [Chloroflexi bacterium]|nr:hypothetical protein [Chloroflexota bacterium]MBI3170165.1 hypothetical protein [Chloroflexota bacterium]